MTPTTKEVINFVSMKFASMIDCVFCLLAGILQHVHLKTFLNHSIVGIYCAEESGVLRHRGDFASVTNQGLPFLMPSQGSLLPVSHLGESEASLVDLNEKTSPSSKQQTTQPGQAFMVMSGGTSGSKSYFPPVTVPPQQLQNLLSHQGQIAYGMPPHLGGTLFLAPQGQLPCAMTMQEGTSSVNTQHVQPPQTSLHDECHHGVPVPTGLPKEVEFPGPITEQPPARSRERWEIKPRRPRPPTDAERQRAMDEAYEFWTPNPHVMVALKPSQVYAGFSLVSLSFMLNFVWDNLAVTD